MHSFAQADAFAAEIQIAIIGWQIDRNPKPVEIRLLPLPMMLLDRIDGGEEQDLEICLQALSGICNADRPPPAAATQDRRADMIVLDDIRCEDGMRACFAALRYQRNVIDEIEIVAAEGYFGIADECGQRIGFDQETIGIGRGMNRIADFDPGEEETSTSSRKK